MIDTHRLATSDMSADIIYICRRSVELFTEKKKKKKNASKSRWKRGRQSSSSQHVCDCRCEAIFMIDNKGLGEAYTACAEAATAFLPSQ